MVNIRNASKTAYHFKWHIYIHTKWVILKCAEWFFFQIQDSFMTFGGETIKWMVQIAGAHLNIPTNNYDLRCAWSSNQIYLQIQFCVEFQSVQSNQSDFRTFLSCSVNKNGISLTKLKILCKGKDNEIKYFSNFWDKLKMLRSTTEHSTQNWFRILNGHNISSI